VRAPLGAFSATKFRIDSIRPCRRLAARGLVGEPDVCRPEIVVRRAALFSEIVPQPRQLDDVVRRQNRANQIRLRRGVNFIQVTLIFGLHYKLPDALVESVFHDHVGARSE